MPEPNHFELIKPLVGSSACLLGETVRYDGKHKASQACLGPLNKAFSWQRFCPEVGAGMGVPRPPISLLERDNFVVARIESTGEYCDSALTEYAHSHHSDLARLSGFVLRTRSPSCGRRSVAILNDETQATHFGDGIFSAYLQKHFPHLPTVEDVDLFDERVQHLFIIRVLAHQSLKQVLAQPQLGAWQVFHANHKYLLMAFDEAGYRQVGKRLAQTNTDNLLANLADYEQWVFAALAKLPEENQHLNALQHMQGYFKSQREGHAYAAVREAVESFAKGEASLMTTLMTIAEAAEREDIRYLRRQCYLRYYQYVAGCY